MTTGDADDAETELHSSNSPGSGGKVIHNEEEHDFVFEIDVRDGEPPLKLPYNSSGACVPSWSLQPRR